MESISIEGFAALGAGLGIALFAIGCVLGWLFRLAWDTPSR